MDGSIAHSHYFSIISSHDLYFEQLCISMYFNGLHSLKTDMKHKSRALITGITGFVGKWLSEHLIHEGFEVYGIDRWASCPYQDVRYQQIDILDTAVLSKYLQSINADRIYHLAAISYLPEADLSPKHALEINIMGTISVLDAVKQISPETRTLLIGSSKEYSDSINSDNVAENTHPEPTNFYGISKYAGELIGLQYSRQFDMDVRCTRSFNHTGPAQSPRFVCSDWAKQVASIELGLADCKISVGNLDAVIDFTDVRDVVKAYVSILEKGKKGTVYNVCSNKGFALKWILDYLISKSSKPIVISSDDKKLRAHKTNAIMLGDNSLLNKDTGWQVSIPFERTLEDLYTYWLNELSK